MSDVKIDGKLYSGSIWGGEDYGNPYYKTHHDLYSVVESQFSDYLEREGTTVKDYFTDAEYRCFFRRNADVNQTNSNITIFYPAESGINPGTLIVHNDKVYLVLNQETVENRAYSRSDGINADVMISTYNKSTKEAIRIPAFAYDLIGDSMHKSNTMTTIAGSCELITGDCEMSRKLKTNCEFFAMGNWFKAITVTYKTGIARILSQIILCPGDPIPPEFIDKNERYRNCEKIMNGNWL